MPAFKLSTNLFEKSKLSLKWKTWVEENTDHYELLCADNAKEQIQCLKKIQQHLNEQINVSVEEDGLSRQTLDFLVHVFFISTSKNPVRRVLISYFQNLPDYVKKGIVGPTIGSELMSLCEDLPTEHSDVTETEVSTVIQKNQQLRHNVDTISALIENFALGEGCVSSVAIEILNYLGILQHQFYKSYRSTLSPVQKNETMHHCMETVKLANRICQRSSVTMETRLGDIETMEWYRGIVKQLVQSDIDIIKNDEFLLDCKTTSAMNLCLMLKLTDVGENLLQLLIEAVFPHHKSNIFPKTKYPQPNWLNTLKLAQLSRTDLTDSSYLCLCYGILSMVTVETLVNMENGKCFLLDVLLPEFLELSKRVSDVGSKLLAAKSLYFLTQRIRTYLNKTETSIVDGGLLQRLQGESTDMKTILDFIWTSWEDSVEAVRFTVKDIFENVVNIHQMASETPRQEEQDSFMDSLTVSILKDVSWSCKGKYGVLTVLVRHLGSARMLELHPGIADQVLQQLEEQTLSCYVRDLYDELCSNHLKQLKAGNQDGIEEDGNQTIDWNLWFDCWVEPVIQMLCQSTHMQKKHLIEYVLPKLLKTGDRTLYCMIQTLSERLHGNESMGKSLHKHRGNQLGALIMCVRRARALGLLRNAPNSEQNQQQYGDTELEKKFLFGVVDLDLLKYALVVKDDQIRLDAFALLCESQKTTELVSDTELQLIQGFIPHNMTNQNPAFRQLMLSYLKKFLSRMKESMQVLIRQKTKNIPVEDHITSYKEFLKWTTRQMFNCLYPGSSFPCRTMALNTLSLLMDIYRDCKSFSFYNEVKIWDVQTLFQCLTDTFEDNKIEASRILISCCKQETGTAILEEDKLRDYLDLALTLGVSSRPQDGMTGAYLLRVLIHQPNIFNTLKQRSRSLWNDKSNKDLDGAGEFEQNVELPPFNTDISTQAEMKNENQNQEFSPLNIDSSPFEDVEDNRRFLLLWILMKSLEDQLKVARDNLLVAAANHPMYPTMLCMRYCLNDVTFRKIDRKYHHYWSQLLSRFISLCFKISGIVSPVVHNCSPEGNIPAEALSDLSKQTNLTKVTESEQTVMLMPEYLTVCCWRSVKEISLILGQLTTDLPNMDSTVNSGFLSYSQILSIGEYFTEQLLESKHRGAFELAYTGFVKVTEMLWRSNTPELHCLPRQWLTEVMADIVSDDPNSRLCATRRSAGVPFYIQAIVSSEPTATGRTCFKDTMTKLIQLAYSQPSKDNCNPKVHSLNILRMLYKDSRLKDDVTPYLADGLKVAILGFKSNLWAVRNAATLLMAAMMNRIFGVKRSKDESNLSRKNCQTGKTFFFKYPSLYQFLLDELSEATDNIGTQLHPGLYPILMVLGRLFPSTMEGTDTTLNLAAFIPYVMRCCSSPVLKTRMMAARALQPLVEKDHMTSVFSDLLTLLPQTQEDGISQNQIHGVLLQIQYLLKTVPMLSMALKDQLREATCTTWLTKMDFLVSRSNPCLLTRTCALEISFEMLDKFGESDIMFDKLWHELQAEVASMSGSVLYPHSTPCLSEFICTICELYLKCMCTKINYRKDRDMAAFQQKPRNCSLKQAAVTRSSLENDDMLKKAEKEKNDLQKEQTKFEGDREIDEERGFSKLLSQFEDMSLKLLRSRSDDVRRSYLQMVAQLCCSDSVENIKEEGNGEIFEEFTGAEDCENGRMVDRKEGLLWELRQILIRSRKIHKMLLELCQTETKKECLVDLFKLLNLYSNTIDDNIEGMNRIIQNVTEMWIYKLQHTGLSEEVTASCIDYLGVSLPAMCRNSVVKGIMSINPMTEMVKFINVLTKFCSAPETAVSIQLACAHALVSAFKCDWLLKGQGGVAKSFDRKVGRVTVGHQRDMVMDSQSNLMEKGDSFLYSLVKETTELTHQRKFGTKPEQVVMNEKSVEGIVESYVTMNSPENVGDRIEYQPMNGCQERFDWLKNLYTSVFDLLQVDDLEVKDTMADVMQVMSDVWSRGSPHSYMCTSLLMDHWMVSSLDPGLVACNLLQLIVEDKGPEQRGDERLFDRGEMNTFRDDIDFMQTIDKALMTVLGHRNTPEEDCSTILGQNLKENNCAVSELGCDKRFYNVILTALSTNIPTCKDGDVFHKEQDIFLDSLKHEKYVVEVHKKLLCLKYGLLLTSGTDNYDSVLEAWERIQCQVNTRLLPSLILECINTVRVLAC